MSTNYLLSKIDYCQNPYEENCQLIFQEKSGSSKCNFSTLDFQANQVII